MIAMPNADSHTGRTLQEDNTELVRMGCPMRAASLARSDAHSALLRRRTNLLVSL